MHCYLLYANICHVLKKAFAPDPFCGAPSLRSACTYRTTPVLPSDHSEISSSFFCAPQNPNLPVFIFLRTLSRRTPGVGGRGVKTRSSRILYANSCTMNTYRKGACNTCRMNTHETKDLKFSRMNTYKRTGGVEREAPGSLGESGNKRGASAVRKSGGGGDRLAG